mmetsp:Transcript_108080/g.345170  ORF Transcript_108080/g.345170 Transcript_108080/m.345170 type:complete len:233 (-) Transcript_108080:60-758(-)
MRELCRGLGLGRLRIGSLEREKARSLLIHHRLVRDPESETCPTASRIARLTRREVLVILLFFIFLALASEVAAHTLIISHRCRLRPTWPWHPRLEGRVETKLSVLYLIHRPQQAGTFRDKPWRRRSSPVRRRDVCLLPAHHVTSLLQFGCRFGYRGRSARQQRWRRRWSYLVGAPGPDRRDATTSASAAHFGGSTCKGPKLPCSRQHVADQLCRGNGARASMAAAPPAAELP